MSVKHLWSFELFKTTTRYTGSAYTFLNKNFTVKTAVRTPRNMERQPERSFSNRTWLGPHRVLTPGSVNTHWAILSARPCASVPHAPLTPSHALRSTSYTPHSIIFLSHVKSGILSPIHKEDERVHLHPVLGGAPLSP